MKDEKIECRTLEFRHILSPLGIIIIAGCDNLLVCVDFCSVDDDRLKRPPSSLSILDETEQWLICYFAGKDPGAIPPVSLSGSPFRLAVWEELCKIPYGRTTTYGTIANKVALRMKMPRMSARAVGRAVGCNPINILIPCHRVVGRDGNLTGYRGGLRLKSRLLALEGIDMSQYHRSHAHRIMRNDLHPCNDPPGGE